MQFKIFAKLLYLNKEFCTLSNDNDVIFRPVDALLDLQTLNTIN